jgi:Tol biopolymer transport system component
MSLANGTKLGPYEIVAPLGAGGMGEVYKATDTRLSRTVAIKVLPPHWVADAEMKQRFEREAQTIASLKHPNICVLHDIGSDSGVDFLVMEFLDGETLAERIKRGPLPLDEALDVAIAITDALDKAHRQGVVHRDLKPSNVMLTESGPKLLDFGLAKTQAAANPGAEAPGLRGGAALGAAGRSGLTTPGMLIGTLQYMAPEQLEGGDADARTDIFALGVLLHEMVTGKKVFEGKSRVLLMSAIATTEPPPLSSAEPATPPALDHVVRTCLAKDPADRWQTARDLLAELQAIASGADDGFVSAASTVRRKSGMLTGVLAGVALLAGVATSVPAYLHLRGDAPPDELRFRIPIQLSAQPATLNIDGVAGGRGGLFRPAAFAVSPDGRRLAFVARSPGDPWLLYVRPLGGVAPQPLPGTEDAAQSFWSADNRSIAFVAGSKLKKVEATGGPPQDLCPVTDVFGGTWNREGTILFGSPQGLFKVPAEGAATPELITALDASESGHYWPHFLPDGQHYLYTVWGPAESRAIYVGALGSKNRTRVLAAESNAAYVQDTADRGYLLFHRDKSVYAQVFDLKTFKLSGEPTRISDDMTFDSTNGRGHFSVSQDGALAYFQNSGAAVIGGAQSELAEWHLAWAGRTGQVIETPGAPGVYRGAEVAPDTRRVVVHKHEKNGGDIWVEEPTGAETRLTWDASQHNASPIWSPDGKSVVFSSVRNGKAGLYQTLSDGSGTQDLLFESDLPKAPMSWSPDSKSIVFGVQDPKTGADLWLLTLSDKKAAPFIATQYAETHAQVSPDGKWIAYSSNIVGNRREIHVQAFPSLAGHYQVSTAGGDWPRWRKDAKELFFHSLGGRASPAVAAPQPAFVGVLYSVTVNGSGPSFVYSPSAEVLGLGALNFPHPGGDYSTYSVSPDGQRFLYFQLMPGGATTTGTVGPDPPSGLIVAMHWAAGVKK